MDHSAQSVLESLENFQDYMDGLEIIADMGSGDGEYSHWWATRKISGGKPRNYAVMAVDNKVQIANHFRCSNLRQVRRDWNDTGIQPGKVDLIWCFDSFQYAVDPFRTLRHWWNIMRQDGMLVIGLPQMCYIDDLARWQMYQPSGCYYSWNIVTLIQALAVSGFDCREGFLRQRRHDPFIWAAVYKSPHAPMDLAATNWYHLDEKKLLPTTASECVQSMGYLRHDMMTVEWMDRSRYDLSVESIP